MPSISGTFVNNKLTYPTNALTKGGPGYVQQTTKKPMTVIYTMSTGKKNTLPTGYLLLISVRPVTSAPARPVTHTTTNIYKAGSGKARYTATSITASTQSLHFTIDLTNNMWTYTGSDTNQGSGTVTLTITAYKNSTSSTTQTWHVITVGASKCINTKIYTHKQHL